MRCGREASERIGVRERGEREWVEWERGEERSRERG